MAYFKPFLLLIPLYFLIIGCAHHSVETELLQNFQNSKQLETNPLTVSKIAITTNTKLSSNYSTTRSLQKSPILWKTVFSSASVI